MRIKNILCLYLLVLVPAIGSAQNDLQGKTSEWTISEQTDLSSGNAIQQSSIVVISDTEVSWGPSIDDGFTMPVTGISGSWDSSTNLGSSTYTLQFEGGSGIATLVGNENELSITLNLTFDNGSSNLKFKVEGITYN